MTRSAPIHSEDDPTGPDPVAACWRRRFGELAPDADARVAGATSLDLLGLELDLRRTTGKAVSLEALDGPVTLNAVRTAVAAAEDEAESNAEAGDHPGTEASEPAPATMAQASQWLAERLRPRHRGYLVPLVVELPDGTTWSSLSRAMAAVFEAHPALRTTIVADDGDPPDLRQRVAAAPRLPVIEPRSVASIDDETVRRLVDGLGAASPGIGSGRPVRTLGLVVDGRLRALMLVLHHAAVDDPSLRILVEDLTHALDGDPVQPERRPLEHVARLQETDAARERDAAGLTWWRERLEGVPRGLRLAASPTGSHGRRRIRRIDPVAREMLDASLRRSGGVRASAVLRAVRRAVRIVGLDHDDEIAVGVPMSLRDHPDLDRTVGMMLNTLPIPVSIDDDLDRIGRTVREARRRRYTSYESLAQGIGSPGVGRSPWLDLVVGVVEADRGLRPDSEYRVGPMIESPFPILVIARFDDDCRLEIDVDPAWIDDTTAERFADALRTQLEAIAAGIEPDDRSIMAGPISQATPRALPDIVSTTARRTPDAVAIETVDGSRWSYAELDVAADRLAGRLVADGRPVDAPIGLLMEPGAGFPIGVLAAMRAGGAAMPMPAEAPVGRIAFLLSRARPEAVLVEGAAMRSLAEAALRESGIEAPVFDVLEASQVVTEAPGFEVDPRTACYVLFTSGSTGEPKAVRMHHAGLHGLLEHERARTPAEVAARTAQYAPLGFDVAFQELFSTWSSGGTLVPVPRATRRDPVALARFLADASITRLHLSPLVLRALASACPDGFPSSLCELVAAGEALRIDDPVRRAALRTSGGIRLVNQYGPTETHVATSHVLAADPACWPDLPAIGAPIDGLVVRVEDEQGGAVSIGTTGELVVEGEGVALGYLDGNAGGFEHREDVRSYRTGDLVRCREDGRLEYLGRRDEQLKISGYRVEPGEIESAITSAIGVEDAAVVAVDRDEDPSLVAFVTGSGVEIVNEAIAETRRRLPPWMVPSRVEHLDALPRSTNGKVDRRRLREMARGLSGELRLVGGDLGVPEIMIRLETTAGTTSDGRDGEPLGLLGLDSLGAIRLQMAIRDRFDVEIPVGDLLGASLGQLRNRLGGTAARTFDANPVRATVPPTSSSLEDAWAPLDPLVRDVLAEDALAPDGAFHLAWTVHFTEDLPVETLAGRMATARRRHATLRTRRRADRGELVIDTDRPLPVDLEDFPGEPSPEEMKRILRHPLRVAEGAPWRAATWPRADGGRDLLIVMHHVAVDGRTAATIVDEIVKGDAMPSPVRSSGGVETDLQDDQWWVGRIREVWGEQSLPAHGFDREQGPVSAMSTVAASSFRRAAERAAMLGLPPIAPALVAWGLLLARSAGRDRALIGVPFATDVADAGLGASILPVPIALNDDLSVLDSVRAVGHLVADGIERRGAALGRIVRMIEPDAPHVRPPLDGVLTRDDPIRVAFGHRIEWTSTGASVFRAGLVVPSAEAAAPAAIEIDPEVLDGEKAENLLERWAALLDEISRDIEEESSRRLGDLDALRTEDRALLATFASGDASSDGDSVGVVSRFLEQVARSPDAVAVIDAEGETTYAELDRWSGSVARALQSVVGSIEGRAVAIAGGRGPATIAAMIGVARAGGWFVPLDDDLPEDRRLRQVSLSRPIAGLAPHADAARVPGVEIVLDPAEHRDGDGGEIAPVPGGGDPFYAMFTSGTTGEPRGAVVPHRAVVRLADDPWFLPGDAGFRMLHAAPLAFDASTLEIWWPLLNGGTVCCWEGAGADLPGIAARIQRDRIDGCWLTAALFHAAVDGLHTLFDGMKVVLTGGDVVSPEHVRRLHAIRPDLAIVNGYGPTENTVFTACESIVPGALPGAGAIPIGRPIRGTRLRVIDGAGRSTPPGRFGELVASGSGVGLGYLGPAGRPEDRDGFERDPETGDPRYRTGDRVRWTIDGRLEFAGRLDGQVKLAGRRIELGAIETALRGIDGVLDACATLVDDRGRPRLGAVFVAERGRALVPAEIRGSLERRLPAWEVPGLLDMVESIPATRNGKADRRAVASMLEKGVGPVEDGVVSVTGGRQDEIVSVVRRAVAEVSGRASVPADRSVRELGIDSLDLLRLALELEKRVARPVRLVDVLEGGSPAAIAERIAEDIDREHADVVTLHPGGSSRTRSLYCIPGVGGTVFSFSTILDGLPAWLPVHGLPYPGTSGRRAPIRRVDGLGAVFADRIRHASPASILLGYSLGGFAAFEAARILAAEGPAPTVVVIDTSPAALPSRRSFAARVTSARDWKMRFRNVLPQGVIDRLGGGNEKGRAIESLRAVVAAGFEAMRFHDPAPAPVDVVVVRTTETDFGPIADIADLGWGEIARNVEVVEIPTAHLEVFRGGSMDLARVVRAVVERDRHR